jgi:hypothetical protein
VAEYIGRTLLHFLACGRSKACFAFGFLVLYGASAHHRLVGSAGFCFLGSGSGVCVAQAFKLCGRDAF